MGVEETEKDVKSSDVLTLRAHLLTSIPAGRASQTISADNLGIAVRQSRRHHTTVDARRSRLPGSPLRPSGLATLPFLGSLWGCLYLSASSPKLPAWGAIPVPFADPAVWMDHKIFGPRKNHSTPPGGLLPGSMQRSISNVTKTRVPAWDLNLPEFLASRYRMDQR
jgi:hypothetical protein